MSARYCHSKCLARNKASVTTLNIWIALMSVHIYECICALVCLCIGLKYKMNRLHQICNAESGECTTLAVVHSSVSKLTFVRLRQLQLCSIDVQIYRIFANSLSGWFAWLCFCVYILWVGCCLWCYTKSYGFWFWGTRIIANRLFMSCQIYALAWRPFFQSVLHTRTTEHYINVVKYERGK